jgi:hypothetical protein
VTTIAVKRPGEAKLKDLFQPGRIGKFEVKNRIKYGACCVSNYNGRDGTITPRELARVRVIAGTGCGLITNQGAYPDPLGEGKAYFRQVAIHDDKFLPQFEMIARYIHDAGAMAIQQILHAGRYGGIDLGYCVQPSVVPQTLPHFRPPREMTKEQIRSSSPARRRRQARDPRRLRRHRDHQLHGLPAGQLQLALHQPAHRRIRRLGAEPRPLHARTDRRHQAGHARQSALRAAERRRADGQAGAATPRTNPSN